MIYTCSYKNFNTSLLKGVSISKDKGKDADWMGEVYLNLAPKEEFFRVWKNNIGKVNDVINNTFYIEQYYKQVLSDLDPLKVYRDLDYSFLLCYEDNDEFCHRHIVAAWFELFLGLEVVQVVEVKVKGLYKEEVSRQKYFFIKDTLERIIKENINMRGFSNLRSLYLFNQGEMLEKKANELELDNKNNKTCNRLYQTAAFLRSEADYEEEKYNENLVLNKNKKDH